MSDTDTAKPRGRPCKNVTQPDSSTNNVMMNDEGLDQVAKPSRGRPPKQKVLFDVKPHRPRYVHATPGSYNKTQKSCICCPSERASQALNNFFASSSPLHADGYVPICKTCIIEKSFDYDTGDINIDNFKAVLRQIDKPYLPNVLDSAQAELKKRFPAPKPQWENRYNIIGFYFKNLYSLPQYKNLRYADGELEAASIIATPDAKTYATGAGMIRPEIRSLFGSGFDDDDYFMLQKNYDEWVDCYGDTDDKAVKEVYALLCITKLQTLRGIRDGENVNSSMNIFKTLLDTSGLKPKSRGDLSQATPLGVLIRDMEQYAPAEYFDDKQIYKDYAGIEDYLNRFVVRPMRNTFLGTREEDTEYTVVKPDDKATEQT